MGTTAEEIARGWALNEVGVSMLTEQIEDYAASLQTRIGELERERDNAVAAASAMSSDVSELGEALASSRAENARMREALEARVGSRSGPAMTAVVAALHTRPRGQEWTTAEVLAAVPAFAAKQVYNALGYLVRHGRLNKSGYGRYRLPADRVLTEGRK